MTLSAVELAYRRFDGIVPAEIVAVARRADADRADWLARNPRAAYAEAIDEAQANLDFALKAIDGVDEYVSDLDADAVHVDYVDFLGVRHVGHIKGLREYRRREVERARTCAERLAQLHQEFADKLKPAVVIDLRPVQLPADCEPSEAA